MKEGPVVTCLRCERVLNSLNLKGRVGRGLARTAEFQCPCGAKTSVITRASLPPGEVHINYRRT